MNLKNRSLYIADNLDVMRGMNSNIIDLIYLDPPFNSNRNYKAPIGSPAEGAEFKDIWTDADIKDEWKGEIADMHPDLYEVIKSAETIHSRGMHIYLTAMAVRLFEMKRILKDTGSIYLHCDPTASHYLKICMDTIFGKKNFRAEITWKRHGAHNDKVFGSISDTILYYSSQIIEISDKIRLPISKESKNEYTYSDKNQKRHGKYKTNSLITGGASKGEGGKPWKNIKLKDKQWKVPRTGEYAKYIEKHFIKEYSTIKSIHQRLDLLDKIGLIHWSKNRNPSIKQYQNSQKGHIPQNIWTDIKPRRKKERTGYPTEKPIKLLERIIRTSSNQGDWIFDPFCGCATTMIAAERLGRKWIGIDISPDAEDLAKMLLEDHAGLMNAEESVKVLKKIPKRSDVQIPRPSDYKNDLYAEQNGQCNGCKDHFKLRNFSIDHIRPRSKGGSDDKENLQLLCHACNSQKGTKSQTDFLNTLKEQGVI